MATVYINSFTGGSGLTTKGGKSAAFLATVIRELITDVTNIRTAFVTLTAKIDADSGDTGGDNNYATTCDPAAMSSING